MATKLYFINAASPIVFGGKLTRQISTSIGTSLAAISTTPIAGSTEIQWVASGTPIEWISDRIASDVTVSNTFTINLWGSETVTSVNVGFRVRIFRLASNGTETEMPGGPFDSGTELTTVNSVYNYSGTPSIGGFTFLAGDRIIFRVYATNIGTMGSVGAATFRYNGTTTDASGDTYITFTETITFGYHDGGVSKTITNFNKNIRGVVPISTTTVKSISNIISSSSGNISLQGTTISSIGSVVTSSTGSVFTSIQFNKQIPNIQSSSYSKVLINCRVSISIPSFSNGFDAEREWYTIQRYKSVTINKENITGKINDITRIKGRYV